MTWTAAHEAALQRARGTWTPPEPAAPAPAEPRRCRECGGAIVGRSARAVYCSRTHRTRASHRRWRRAHPERWRAMVRAQRAKQATARRIAVEAAKGER